MPSSTPKQHRFMEAVAHNPDFAKRAGVPQSVGKDFAAADDKAGITKTHSSNRPKNRDEHMAQRKGQGLTFAETAREFGTSKSTAHRRTKGLAHMMRHGYTKE